jgi:hypothetical protein
LGYKKRQERNKKPKRTRDGVPDRLVEDKIAMKVNWHGIGTAENGI